MKYGASPDHPLQARIEAAYLESGNGLGWRFLYSPVSVLKGARVAFVTQHPLSDEIPDDFSRFATMRVSAFATERWGRYRAGQNPLQRQVLSLFDALGIAPTDVLAGTFVPFAATDWAALAGRRKAVVFARDLWQGVLSEAKPSLVITSGKLVGRELGALLDARETLSLPIGWGSIEATRSEFDGGSLISLPSLARYPVITRPQSTKVLKRLFLDHWRR